MKPFKKMMTLEGFLITVMISVIATYSYYAYTVAQNFGKVL